ncbi:BQ5605_C010g05960 [Microbotryum silenes-dioicae]|uniref:NADPH--cytochrome P450 reductase n=1 Tax=Microbotryum silenes-dioicae TaxID=796604 RepID=A0A2X0LQ45_9BASI|nr:BQ5605_C010g05960 [Microbotryum silenes-dioicae]
MAIPISQVAAALLVILVAAWFFSSQSLDAGASSSSIDKAGLSNGGASHAAAGDEESSGRDFVAAMLKAKKKIVIFYGSQTGTAEDYGTRIAKEAKSRYGLSSLVCDPEDFLDGRYDFETLDQVPEDALVVFCVATYGEGEPTDNAVGLMDFLKGDTIELSKGGDSLENLNYVIFALGNSTYEHFCAIGRQIDERLSKLGAKRVGELGEGDDDKNMEEDYLSWKDGMWEAVQKQLGWEEGAGGDVADFEVTEKSEVDEAKVFLGELSHRALTGTRGVFDAKNPYAAPILEAKELFEDGDRNCVHAEFDISDSGVRYQTGDHVGVWPLNPDAEVERWLRILGLSDKRDQVIDVKSLDPALAKVPFPVPTTYDTVLRHYVDVSGLASRQTVGSFAKYAPTEDARRLLEQLGSDKALYQAKVGAPCYKTSQVLLLAAGDSLTADPASANYKQWSIPFDRVISSIPRLHPRYYSISSSPKLYPTAIHITAVVLKYQAVKGDPAYSYGVGTNYILNLKVAHTGGARTSREEGTPVYKIEGPRGKYKKGSAFCAPIHVRRSNFRLPTSPKIPVVMVGPGTGVAPFRAFIQERVALARKAKEKDGADALKDWGTIDLFYGCRRSDWDFLYKDEWKAYEQELDGKFRMHVALSREPNQPKVYVQQLIKDLGDHIGDSLVARKGYAYICGDAKHMAREVEDIFEDILGKAKGGSKAEGARELKLLKDRNRLLLDVWS